MPCSAVLGTKQYSTDAHPENHAGTFYYFIQNRNPGAEGKGDTAPSMQSVHCAHSAAAQSTVRVRAHNKLCRGRGGRELTLYRYLQWLLYLWARLGVELRVGPSRAAASSQCLYCSIQSHEWDGAGDWASNELTLRLHNNLRRLLTHCGLTPI